MCPRAGDRRPLTLEREGDLGTEVREHGGSRADLVDLSAGSYLDEQVDDLAALEASFVGPHKSEDVLGVPSVLLPNGFLTRPASDRPLAPAVWVFRPLFGPERTGAG